MTTREEDILIQEDIDKKYEYYKSIEEAYYKSMEETYYKSIDDFKE